MCNRCRPNCQPPRQIGRHDVGNGGIFVIREPGVYHLCSDVTVQSGPAIEIAASCVTLDLQQHTIDGSGQACVGVLVSGSVSDGTVRDNVIVRNGTLKNFRADFVSCPTLPIVAGLTANGAKNLQLHQLTVLGALNGIGVSASEIVKITACKVADNADNGVAVEFSSAIVVQDLCANGGSRGLRTADCRNLVCENGVVARSQLSGFLAVRSFNLTYRNCTAQETGTGFAVLGTNVLFDRCTAQGCTSDGWNCFNITELTMRSCTGADCQRYGLLGVNVGNGAIEQCLFDGNAAGVLFDTAQNLLLRDCVSKNSTSRGYDVLDTQKLTMHSCVSAGNGVEAMTIFNTSDILLDKCTLAANSFGLFVDANCVRTVILNCSATGHTSGWAFWVFGECAVVGDNTAANNGTGFIDSTSDASLFYGNRSFLNTSDGTNVTFVDLAVATTPYQNVARAKQPPALLRQQVDPPTREKQEDPEATQSLVETYEQPKPTVLPEELLEQLKALWSGVDKQA